MRELSQSQSISSIVGAILLVIGVILIIFGLGMALAIASVPLVGPLAFLVVGWFPLLVFVLPGIVVAYAGYRLMHRKRISGGNPSYSNQEGRERPLG